jgi:hypothetical protein
LRRFSAHAGVFGGGGLLASGAALAGMTRTRAGTSHGAAGIGW